MRLRSKWNAKNRDRSPQEIAGVMGFNAWRIAMQAVLDLENNDFQTDTQAQRLAIIWEFAAFLIHITDREMYTRMDGEERRVFISAMAKNMVQTMCDNMADLIGPGDYASDLIDTLNLRMTELSRFNYDPVEGPSFPMLRFFGEAVTAVMGERNRKWVTTHIIDIEAPDAVRVLKRNMASLLPEEKEEGGKTGSV